MANTSYYPTRNYSIQDSDSVGSDVRREVYYPWEVSKLPQGTSAPFGAVFIVVNAALGAGLLAFPLAFFQAGGFIEGIAIELVLFVFVITGALVLAYAAEHKLKTTYEDTVEAVCGPVVKVIAEICLLAFCFGSNIAYLVIIQDQLEDMTEGIIQTLNKTSQFYDLHMNPVWYIDGRFMLCLAALVFILPWLFFKKIGVLSYTSFIGVLCCFYIALVITVKYFFSSQDYCSSTVPDHCPRSWPDVINAIPFICFGYQCHVSSIPVYVGLKKRNLRRFSVIIVVAVFICFFVYTLTGTFGYLTFHPRTCIDSDILVNYCPGNVPISVARGMLAFVMVTSYPILTFCGRTPLDSLFMKLLRLCHMCTRNERCSCAERVLTLIEKHKWTRLRVESLVWFVVTLTLALLVKQISNVVSLTGGLAATFIFLFPGMMIVQFSLTSETLSRFKKALLILYGCFIIVIGCFIFGNSLVYTIMHDIGLF